MLKLDEDPTKTAVQTRDGRPAKIYAVYEGQGRPIHGAVQIKSGGWQIVNWLLDGLYFSEDREGQWDLVNQPPPAVEVTGWAVWPKNGEAYLSHRKPMMSRECLTAIQRVTVTVTPGVFE